MRAEMQDPLFRCQSNSSIGIARNILHVENIVGGFDCEVVPRELESHVREIWDLLAVDGIFYTALTHRNPMKS